MTWFQHLLVDQYGTYAQFVDTTCRWSTAHCLCRYPTESEVCGTAHSLTRTGFPWFAVIDVTVVVGCQAFNLDRAYRINQNSLWVIVGIAPSM